MNEQAIKNVSYFYFTLQEVVMEIQELPSITRFIPKILLAMTVTVCDEVYKKIAYWLNDMGKKKLNLMKRTWP